jgi:hypothetical protein
MTPPDLGQFCRVVETHLCQVNGGHLVRVVGPAFELVKRWHADGVPLKIVLRGIDRRAERARRSTTVARRPLRVEFCEADVADVFDEWRRAIGFALVTPAEALSDAQGTVATDEEAGGVEPDARSAQSLPKHLERVATRLTSFLVSATDAAPALRDRAQAALAEVDAMRRAGRLRGEARTNAVHVLESLDAGFLEHLLADAPSAVVTEAIAEARQELAAYEPRVPAPEFDRLVRRAAQRLVRSRLRLPELRLS